MKALVDGISSSLEYNTNPLAQQGGFSFVEPAGVEPASKHMPNMLSTCVFLYWFSETSRKRTNLLIPNLLWFSSGTHSLHQLILPFVDSAAGTAADSLPGGYKGYLISD